MYERRYLIGAVLLVIVLAAGSWYTWQWSRQNAPVVAQPPAAQPPPTTQPPAAPPPAPEAKVAHPLEAPAASAAPSTNPEVALTALFGRRTVLMMFQLSDFPHRLVATVDNLGRAAVTARLWPLVPVGGRFSVQRDGGNEVISAANDRRYEPYVRLLEGVDAKSAVATYLVLYPQLQKAYADLGYPDQYFNDRLIEVIDLLLTTPDAATPPKVHLPTLADATQPTQLERPSPLYEFDDPELQALPAGQRILLRMGADNERRVKSRLRELRQQLLAAESRH